MNSNVPQQNYSPQFNPYYGMEYEISLVDLAKILVKRRLWFFSVAIFVMAIGIIFTLTRDSKVEFISYYQVSLSNNAAIEPIATTVQKLEDLFIPKLYRDYEKSGAKQAFGIEIEPKKGTSSSTNYITIITNAAETQKEEVNKFHKKLFEILDKDQATVVDKKKEATRTQIKEMKVVLAKLSESDTPTALEKSANYIDQISKLENELFFLQNAEVLSVSQKGKSKSKAIMLVAVSAVASIILGLITVFFVEFAMQVRKSLEDDKIKELQK